MTNNFRYVLIVILLLVSINYAICVDLTNESTYQGLVVSASGHYTINGNVTLCEDTYTIDDDANTGALIIDCADCYLDCNNSIINGTDNTGYGIYNYNDDNVNISNCQVLNYNCGVYIYKSDNNLLSNNNITSNDWYGIHIKSSNNNSLINNTVNSNGMQGIYTASSIYNIITNNTCKFNTHHGIEIWGSNFNTLINNTCDLNGEHGISIYAGNNNSLTNNIATNNDQDGVYIRSDSADNEVINTRSCSNNQDGGAYHDFRDATSPLANTFTNSTYDTDDPDNYVYFDQRYYCNESEVLWPYSGCVDLTNESTYQDLVVNSSGHYNINGNVTLCEDTYTFDVGSSPEIAINMNCTDCYLDCNDSIINGTDGSGYGIYNTGNDNVDVSNCQVTDYNTGLYFKNSDGHTIINNTFIDIWGNGIYFYNSDGNTFDNNNATDNTRGYLLWTVTNSTFNNTYALNNSNSGVHLWSDSNSNNFTNTHSCYNNEVEGSYYDLLDATSLENNFTNSTYDTDDPDNYVYFDKAFWCNTSAFTPTSINVTLTYPDDDATIETNETTLNYSVNIESNCTVYYNVTGTWSSDCTSNETTSGSCSIGPASNDVYIWNVYCEESLNSSNNGWAEDTNRTFTINYVEEEEESSSSHSDDDDECDDDSDCDLDEFCNARDDCEQIDCDDGYIEDHECIEYECTSDSDCDLDEECNANECVEVEDDEVDVVNEDIGEDQDYSEIKVYVNDQETFYFNHDDNWDGTIQNHKVVLIETGEDENGKWALFRIYSDPIEVKVYEGETKEVDLNADDITDVTITLESVESDEISLKVESLEASVQNDVIDNPTSDTNTIQTNVLNDQTNDVGGQPHVLDEQVEPEQGFSWIIILIIIIAIFIVGIVFLGGAGGLIYHKTKKKGL